jgi:hypothetical protein
LIQLLLMVVVFMGVMALLVLGIVKLRAHAGRYHRMNVMSQCAKAAHNAHDSFKTFPPYYGLYGGARNGLTFHAHLLQYLDQAPLYKELSEAADDSGQNGTLARATIPAFVSEMDMTLDAGGAGVCNFPVNLRLFYTQGGTGALSSGDSLIYPRMPNSFTDGTSNTLLLATKYMHCGSGGSLWMDPGNNAPDSPTAATFGLSMERWQRAPSRAACKPYEGTAVSFTPENIQVALCDASVRSVSPSISLETWQAVHTPSAGDAIGPDWDF